MQFDVIIVLHNSAGWLRQCVAALAASNYDLPLLRLWFVDNASRDDTVVLLGRLQQEYPGFGGFTVICNALNEGFGRACNRGAAGGNSPWLFFLNPDCEVTPDCFAQMAAGIAQKPDAGGFECRQLPYEMDHHLDPVTLEVPWASGAVFVVRRTLFQALGGFDKHLFLYCEDVDLSWRIRAAGQAIFYLPRAVVMHQVLQREDNAESERREYTQTVLGRLLLAYKYRGLRGIWQAHRRYLHTLRAPQHFPGVRRLLARGYLRHFGALWPFLFWRFGHRALYQNAPAQLEGDFAPQRGRAVLEERLADGPIISVVIRTHKRPARLRGALQSIANQTYPNYEVVVVEDGAPTAKGMIEAEFGHLPLRYHATGTPVGRGKAGNIGLDMARGDYLNFLDDDDYFYPDHLELMAATATAHPEADLVIGRAMVAQAEVVREDPYEIAIQHIDLFRFDRVDVFTMCQTCQIPIQSAIFKKSLYQRCGGLAEEIDGYEDWAMWMRFLKVAKRIDPRHVDIHRATSLFILPAGQTDADRRADHYHKSYATILADPQFHYEVTLADLRYFYDGMVADIAHLHSEGEAKLAEYLDYHGNRDKLNRT